MKGLSVEYPMYFGAKPSIFKLAKELRKSETEAEAEKILWSKLNKNQIMGLHFRRQHPINVFIADFFCPEINLVIEVDGSIHDIIEYSEHDIGRSDVLNAFGITVIRFSNEEIINDTARTINNLTNAVKDLLQKTKIPG